MLLTTHYLEEAEALCNRIAMLKKGRIVALDRTENLLAGTASTMLRFKTDQALPADVAAQAEYDVQPRWKRVFKRKPKN